jgi:hypothetical protein
MAMSSGVGYVMFREGYHGAVNETLTAVSSMPAIFTRPR